MKGIVADFVVGAHVEDRHLRDPDWAARNAAVNWGRLAKAVGGGLRGAVGRAGREVGASTLGSEVERGRKEASSELLGAICGALDVPLSRVLSDAGDQMTLVEGAEFARASASNIDSTTKVVIPQVVSMAVA